MRVFHFGEGSFEPVAGLVDTSVQAYMDGPEENKTGLVITRQARGNLDLRAHAEGIDHALGLQMRRYERLSLEEGKVGGLPAVLLQVKLLHEGVPMYQSLALIGYHDVLLTCTVAGPFARRERCEEIMDSTLETLRFRASDGSIEEEER